MALETYRIWLRAGLFIHIVFLQQGGEVRSFAVVLVTETTEGFVNVARYDTAHGIPHRDVLGRTKGLLRKQWFPTVPLVKVLDLAIRDFKENHETYLQHYQKS